MREQQGVVEREKEHLEAQLLEWQQKWSQQGNEILALRGRLTNSRKACDKLQAQCSQLERDTQFPKVVKVYARRKEEERLLEECKRKVGVWPSLVGV